MMTKEGLWQLLKDKKVRVDLVFKDGSGIEIGPPRFERKKYGSPTLPYGNSRKNQMADKVLKLLKYVSWIKK